MLAQILSEKYSVNKTEANNNNNIGVPLTILNTNETHHVLVAELERITLVKYLTLQTFFHLIIVDYEHRFFASCILENKKWCLERKIVLFEETISNGGKVFLNYDDPIIRAKHSSKGKQISYGFSGGVDVQGE